MLNAIRQMFKKMKDQVPSFSLRSSTEERFNSLIRGEIFWELRDGATGQLQDSGHFKNVVTLDASILLARFLKFTTVIPHSSEPSFGVFALAMGTGDVGWDTSAPPIATNTQRSLFNEIARKQIAVAN